MTNCFIVFCLYSVLLLMRILFSLSSISLPLNVESAVMYIYMCFVKTADDVKCIFCFISEQYSVAYSDV